ncbi:hypothetical protein VP01_1566g2 [Puccinia sorghi]|uniref:Uncharacterized protein n=1 Tax=Puccinia sorghi TaxID=27349 RepID=A0A0L6VJR3_9BASI|nr:hypothetical protein VP01_1566g2 [Puccinia sorghi]
MVSGAQLTACMTSCCSHLFLYQVKPTPRQMDEAKLFKDGPTQVKLSIPPNLWFNLSQLQTINVSNFYLTCQEIQIPAALGSLIEACGKYSKQMTPLLTNPWRTKETGRLNIRDVPINLYSDDTSGNICKPFKKHIAYHFTLYLFNTEYTFHFLCTSNTAQFLELGEQFVDQLSNFHNQFLHTC